MLWASAAISYWSEISDHYNTKSKTRSNLSAILNFFQHNKGYHSLHHKYPNIPWHNLPMAYKEIKKLEINLAEDESYSFVDVYRQIGDK
jgi:fatty acid desaturase